MVSFFKKLVKAAVIVVVLLVGLVVFALVATNGRQSAGPAAAAPVAVAAPAPAPPVPCRAHEAPAGRRSQVRAVVTDYPKTQAEWITLAQQCQGGKPGQWLVVFFNEYNLAAWDGRGGDFDDHYLCQVTLDDGQANFSIADGFPLGAKVLK